MLRNALLAGCALVAVVALVLFPALAPPAWAHEEAPMPAPTGDGFQSDVAADLERTGQKLVALAEAIPADKYGWRPAEGVRSVSEVFVHTANTNTFLPPGMGSAPREGLEVPKDIAAIIAWMQEQEASVTAKDQVVAELKKSIDYAAAAVRAMSGPALEEQMDLFGFPASRRAYALILLTHNHEHLGQAIAYARSLGVTPPWSQPPPAAAEEAEEEDAADSSY